MGRRIVIVGGGAGGAGAAAKARRTDEKAEIALFEKGPFISYANCGLPYYIGGDIKERDKLLINTPEHFARRFNVDVRTSHEVTRIDREAKTVAVTDLTSGDAIEERYDALILAVGARAVVPPLPGIEAPNIFLVRTVPDVDAIRAYIDTHGPKEATVVGGGFIGLEMAEALRNRGMKVTVVELLPQLMPTMDEDMAVYLSRHLREKGLHVLLGDGVEAFSGGERVGEITLQSGRKLRTDLVILSIGIKPEVALAAEAGLAIGQAGGILVDEYQLTSDPDIYAAGDATEVIHWVTGKKVLIPLAGPANKQGRVAGANAAGGNLRFAGCVGTSIVKVCDLHAAKTGLSEREAKAEGFDYFVTYTHPLSHAGYYPGGEVTALKVVVESTTGRLLGAQIVGKDKVDKRIDVFAVAIQAGFTVDDLAQMDLAYAPPFSSAKDPTVMAGFVGGNVLSEEMVPISWSELVERMSNEGRPKLVDVRTPKEYEKGHIPGAVLMPVDELRGDLGELEPDEEIVLYCRQGIRSYIAQRILKGLGYSKVLNLSGGWLTWEKAAPEDLKERESL